MTTQKIPKEPKGWAKLAEQHGVLHQNIHDLDVLDSASKIKDKQFYALRVLWQQHKLFPSESEFCDREVLKEAESFLSKWPSWNAYLENIKASAGSSSLSTIDDIGAFSSARYYQMRTYSSPLTHDVGPVLPKIVPSPSPIAHRTRRNRPTPASSGYPLTPTPMSRSQKEKQPLSMTELNSPLTEIEEYPSELMQDFNVALYPESPANPAESLPSEDEQIVNTALMLFLDNVTIYHPNVKAEGSSSPRWTMKRLQLKCGSWEARTDGFLRMGSDGSKVRAILETKPHVRTRSLDAIQKQESAQMAAWICQSPNGNFSVSGKESPYFRRLLISQDSNEIYLTIAKYDAAYVNYILGDAEATSGKPSLMTMHQYGPWKTMNHEDMENLGILILAFTLQQFSNDSSQEDPFTDPGKRKS